jgi:hypothetical protein
MSRGVLWILAATVWAGTLEVEVRDSEVWLIRDGQARQLTHDGKAKLQAELSPSQDRVAYYEQCPQAEQCMPTVVILDLEGRRTGAFAPKGHVPCASILSIAWTGRNRVAAECHINPSLSDYIETDISDGRTTRHLSGYDFTVSPDGKQVAHVGWIIHFAPRWAQSNYLQVENTTVYPLPKGVKPTEQKELEGPPQVVRHSGATYYGIHDFHPGLAWSPDSRHIALLDCTFDLTVPVAGALDQAGVESNRRCAVAAVAAGGQLTLYPVSSDLRQARLSWEGPHQLWLEANGERRSFRIP